MRGDANWLLFDGGLAAKKVAVDQVYDFEAETLEINSGMYTIEGNALYNRDTVYFKARRTGTGGYDP